MSLASELAPADHDLRAASATVLRPVESWPGFRYLAGTTAVGLVAILGFICWGWQMYIGMGVSGLMWPVMWGAYITNYVFWIAIAMSGTFLSAALYLFRARFRSAFSRAAETMTIWSILSAGLFPLIHLGRSWRAYWILPYPNQRRLWPNFRSSLVLDSYAITTYLAVSLVFWYIGMLPDLAELRDRATGWRRTLYGIASLGWTGSIRDTSPFLKLYILLAGLELALVFSVHTTVAWDFSTALIPGWHEEIFPPYFVAGAVFSGLAMILTLIIPIREWFHLHDFITVDHLEKVCQLIIVASSVLTFSYATEYFIAWYSADTYERSAYWMRAFGRYSHPFWMTVAFNCALPLLFFWRRFRRSIPLMFIMSILMNVGMWLERFVFIVTSLAYSFDPAAWGIYHVTWIEIGITAGGFGGFLALFLLSLKVIPALPTAEVRRDILEARRQRQALAAVGLWPPPGSAGGGQPLAPPPAAGS